MEGGRPRARLCFNDLIGPSHIVERRYVHRKARLRTVPKKVNVGVALFLDPFSILNCRDLRI